MKHSLTSIIAFIVVSAFLLPVEATAQDDGWHLIWQDEFDVDGIPDSTKWTYERGFERNEELQWYTPENVFQRDGHLVIEARPADFPWYLPLAEKMLMEYPLPEDGIRYFRHFKGGHIRKINM